MSNLDTANIDSTDASSIIKSVTPDALATWSEEKKKDFVKTLEERVLDARYILVQTARSLCQRGQDIGYLSEFHSNKLRNAFYKAEHSNPNTRYSTSRAHGELEAVASTRATALLNELPGVQKALSIVDPETSRMLGELDKLKEKAQKLADKHAELSAPIVMAEVDQNMTVLQFRKHVAQRQKDLTALRNQLTEVATEADPLNRTITKNLYKGIPGLTDALVKAIESQLDRAVALGEFLRRASEKVLFGDSTAAMSLLSHFEKDENEVADDIKAQLKASLAKLQLGEKSLKKGPKKLKR